MVFDQATGEMVLLDPSGSGTWTWDGVHAWSQRRSASAPATIPGKVGGPVPAMAWDPITRSVLAVVGDMPRPGDLVPTVAPPATWSWQSGAWTRLDSVHTPDVVSGVMFSFPPARQLILFSGCCDVVQKPANSSYPFKNAAKPGMWAWDGHDWSEVHPAHLPPARWGATVAYSSELNEAVMYGGQAISPEPPPLTDTWSWNGTDWRQVASPKVPGDFVVSTAAAARGQVVLTAGGQSFTKGTASSDNQTWVWGGTAWVKLDVPTPSCFYCELAYDPVRRLTVLVSDTDGRPNATDEVWTWDGARWSIRSLPA
jgi:hypothetical protein